MLTCAIGGDLVEISVVLIGTFWRYSFGGGERGDGWGCKERLYAFLEEWDGFGCAGGRRGVGWVRFKETFYHFDIFILFWSGVYVVGESGWVMGWPMRQRTPEGSRRGKSRHVPGLVLGREDGDAEGGGGGGGDVLPPCVDVGDEEVHFEVVGEFFEVEVLEEEGGGVVLEAGEVGGGPEEGEADGLVEAEGELEGAGGEEGFWFCFEGVEGWGGHGVGPFWRSEVAFIR